jgi:hypothetical protein
MSRNQFGESQKLTYSLKDMYPNKYSHHQSQLKEYKRGMLRIDRFVDSNGSPTQILKSNKEKGLNAPKILSKQTALPDKHVITSTQ